MNALPDQSIDARAWLLWGAAASLPLLTGRHPVVLLELLIIVVVVRQVCVHRRGAVGWSWLLRLAALAVPIGVIFNVMTVHAGDQVIFRIPEAIPLIGGPVTWNACVYGVLSGLTIVALIAVGTTIAAVIEWSALIRLLPARAGNLAVAGSVAWSFLPRLATSWREIRESQSARGHQWSGVRDFVPLIVPLLAGGLDRSIATAESLEARGFGVLSTGNQMRLPASLSMIAALTAAVAGLYLFATGNSLQAAALIPACGAMALIAVRLGRSRSMIQPTHYRRATWSARDTAASAGAVIALLATGVALQAAPESLRYEPYPEITVPTTEPLFVLLLACLLVPALVAPAGVESGVSR